MFGLQGYVTELLFIVATLLNDRSLGNSGLRRFFFCYLHQTPTLCTAVVEDFFCRVRD
jgi:hypothetical protein